MTPLHFERFLLRIVGHILIAGLGVLKTQEETARIAVALVVVACCRHAPRAFSVYLAEELEVPLVVDGKVVATVAQVESAVVLVAVCRHDEARRVALGEREETVRDGQWQWHISHNQISRTEGYVLARAHLAS